jgi:integrase
MFKVVPPSRSLRRATYVVSGLSRFYDNLGMEDPPLVAPVIEAYCKGGLSPERCSSTRGTYRSVLRQLSDDPRPRTAPRFAGSVAQPPYSTGERAELFSIARAQRTSWRRRSALCVICLSMGAGLRAGEIVAARRHDVIVSPLGVQVRVPGNLSRVVPVHGEAAVVLRRLSRGAGDEHLFHPEEADRSYANFVNDFCRHVVSDPSAPKLSVARLRSSFVCDHLRAGTSLSELLRVTGILEVESLLYYCRHVRSAPQSKAALRAQLAAGR